MKSLRVVGATARAGLALALALSLGACVSLLPKSKPAQLYTFGGARAAAAQPAAGPAGTGPGLVLVGVGFPRASAGDGILTLTGDQAAYIAGSRWVSPAASLFQEAVERAIDRPGSPLRLLGRGDIGSAAGLLRLDVRDFQAVYDKGSEAAPEVAVAVHARLTASDGRLLDARTFEIRKRAAGNRVSAIVRAFDEATAEALTAVVAATEQQVLALPPAQGAAAAAAVTTSTSTSTTTVRRAP